MVQAYLGIPGTEDLSSLFCSELVAGAFKAMGLLPEARAASDFLPPHFHSSRRRKLPLPRGVALSKEIVVDFSKASCQVLALPELASHEQLMRAAHALGVLKRWIRRFVRRRVAGPNRV